MPEESMIDKDMVSEPIQTVQDIKKEQSITQKKEKVIVSKPKETITDKEVKHTSKSPIVSSKKIEEAQEIVTKEKEIVESKEIASSQVVEKKDETPTLTKKVQYSKPNQMCVSRIKRVLRAKNGDISFCYDKQKFKNPALEGSITVQINVHKSRNSIWVKRDTLKDKDLRSCMKSKIRDWDFGPDCYGATFKKSYKLVSG